MTDCSQLQALQDEIKQERQALDHPVAFCQDQCDDGDITCIKQCLSAIAGMRQAADQDIANIEKGMGLCGTWSLVLQGVVEVSGRSVGSLTITGMVAGTANFPLTGTINLPDSLGNTPFSGTYTPVQGTIQLLRPFSDGTGSVEDYRGRVDFSTQPPTMQGRMGIDYGPGIRGIEPIYDWFAQKQP